MASHRHGCRARPGCRGLAKHDQLLNGRRCLLLGLGLLGGLARAPGAWCGARGRLPAAAGGGRGAVVVAAGAPSASEAPAVEPAGEQDAPRPGSLGRRLRDRLADSIAEQEAQVSAVPTEEQKQIQREYVDLNGIEPLACLVGAVPVAALSYGFWTFTGSAAEWFLEHPIETEFYPAQRLGTAFQTAVVGLSSLAAGIFGFTALGIFLLGVRVALGVASGELDPSQESDEPQRQTTAERVRDIFTKDPVDVVMARRRAAGREPASGEAA